MKELELENVRQEVSSMNNQQKRELDQLDDVKKETINQQEQLAMFNSKKGKEFLETGVSEVVKEFQTVRHEDGRWIQQKKKIDEYESVKVEGKNTANTGRLENYSSKGINVVKTQNLGARGAARL